MKNNGVSVAQTEVFGGRGSPEVSRDVVRF